MTNPLLETTTLPQFAKIKPTHFLPAINKILLDNRKQLITLLKQPYFTWENLILPLEDMDNRLHNAWTIISHLNAVINSDTIRKIYNTALEQVTKYSTELWQNHDVYQAIQSLTEAPNYKDFTATQKKLIADKLRDFHLSGVTLPKSKKLRLLKIHQELSQLTQQFANNVLDATQGWTYLANKTEINGMPEHALRAARERALQKKQDGWLFTLDAPSYIAIMTYADNAPLREKFYNAYITRASDLGPNAGKWDNSKVMQKILVLRQQMAKTLGFENYSQLSLATKMVKTPKQALKFMHDLANKSKKSARRELQEVKTFAHKYYHAKDLQPWDLTYYSEKLLQHKYYISQEQLRPYFPINQVLPGMFNVAQKLYGITIKEQKNFSSWHKDVRLFKIFAKNKKLLGYLYLDLYARTNKQGGAWMHDAEARHRLQNNSLQLPIAFVVCNFSAPLKNKQTCLTHHETHTLFHEFGHALQHLLTKIEYFSLSGIHGVLWDAVELPSQFMENWCFEKVVLRKLTKHIATKKPLENALIEKLLRAKNFQASLQMLRQLEFSLFDFMLHLENDPARKKDFIQNTINNVRQQIAVVPIAPFNRFQHSFSHIFAGGYAAGYYSYKWAEVLAADAFAKFRENGLFDHKTAMSFLHNILEPGGAEDPLTLFIKFRDRPPKIDALLKQDGIK